MAMVGLTHLFLVLVNCVLCTETDLEDKVGEKTMF